MKLNSRNPYLDAIRGVAVLLVMFEHFGFTEYFSINFPFGATGVWIFFVLSGYLITSILLKRPSLKAFYKRRALRLLPLYYGSILFLFIPLGYTESKEIVWLLTHTINIKQALDNSWSHQFTSHFWSLSVEEQYYLVWPWIVFRASSYLLVVCAILWLICIAFKIYCSVKDLSLARYTLPISCFDCLCIGGALSVLELKIKSMIDMKRLLAISLSGIIGVIYLSYWKQYAFLMTWLFPTFLSLLICYLIIQAKRAPPVHWKIFDLGVQGLAFTGLISYSLYIFHIPIKIFMEEKVDSIHPVADGLIVLLVCLLFSTLTWLVIERPILMNQSTSGSVVKREI